MTTIFQALKKIKHLDRKIAANQNRIQRWCSHDSEEKSPYDMQTLLQIITDLIKEKARLRAAIHATNVNTIIEFRGKKWSVDGLLCHLNVVLPEQLKSLKMLRRKERGGGFGRNDSDIKYIQEYDPQKRDETIEKIEEERLLINDLLDETNLTTKLVVNI